MNQNVLIFKYSLLAYFEFKKINFRMNENQFFNIFIDSLNQNKLFIQSNFLNVDEVQLLLNQAYILCEFESLTFMPDESIADYENSKKNLNHIMNSIDNLLIKMNYDFTKNFNEHDWRILISFIVTFNEWSKDIKFFEIEKENSYETLKESPLISLVHLK